jgi:hypothetical protein
MVPIGRTLLMIIALIWHCSSVFDVTKGRSHYGPGGGYHHFAGRLQSSFFSFFVVNQINTASWCLMLQT